MKILIKHATILSMSSKREKIEKDIDILIENDKIKQIGYEIEDETAKKIEANNQVVLPGLINTHAHIPMSIFRETLEGYTLQDWLQEKIWPMEDKLTQEDIYWASLLSCMEMIKTGTTMINDMYFMSEAIVKAITETGVRAELTRTVMDHDGQGKMRLEELEDLLQHHQGVSPTITFNVGIHGFYTTNEAYIQKCVELAKAYQLPIHIHFCENETEVKQIKEGYQVQSPVELLKRYFTGMKVILAHAVILNEDEIRELAKLEIAISHCPISNLKLGCGMANIKQMQEEGICVSLGTDGQGSGSSLDLFEAMKYTALLQKGIYQNPTILSADEVLQMATINGAKALGLETQIGSIEEGKKADIIFINMQEVITQPMNNLISELVYNVKGNQVETVIINGKIVMQDKKLVAMKEEEIYEKCNAIIKRIEIDNLNN